MPNIFQHGINLLRHSLRDVGVSTKRSPKWEKLEREFKAAHPTCAACGSTNRLNVHHVMPFHIDPTLELDPTNLITLCMDTNECHLQLGHLGNFKLFNKEIREDAAKALKFPGALEKIIKIAKTR